MKNISQVSFTTYSDCLKGDTSMSTLHRHTDSEQQGQRIRGLLMHNAFHSSVRKIGLWCRPYAGDCSRCARLIIYMDLKLLPCFQHLFVVLDEGLQDRGSS